MFHFAAYEGEYEIIKLLLEKGAKFIVQNKQGDTPLDILRKKITKKKQTFSELLLEQTRILKNILLLEIMIQKR
jgi:Iap family predicted aminopeptidase